MTRIRTLPGDALRVLAIAAMVLSTWAPIANAICDCEFDYSPADAFAQFDEVFLAKVVFEVTTEYERGYYLATRDCWKGIVSPTISFFFWTPLSSDVCGIVLPAGLEYYFYVQSRGSTDVEGGLCNRIELFPSIADKEFLATQPSICDPISLEDSSWARIKTIYE